MYRSHWCRMLTKKGINLCENTWFLVSWGGSPKTNTPRQCSVLFCPRLFAFLAFQVSQNWVPIYPPGFYCHCSPVHGLFTFLQIPAVFLPHFVHAALSTMLCCLPLLTRIPLHPFIANTFFRMFFLTSLAYPSSTVWYDLSSPNPGFLNLSTTDMLDQILFLL